MRFTDEVKQYLSTKFDLGERTGNKADPGKVAADMRTLRKPDGSRMFEKKDWLTASQVQGVFSRLAATRRRQGNQEVQIEDVYAEKEEQERHGVLKNVAAQVSPRHPICYDSYCLCDLSRDEKLDSFSVVMLKEILKRSEKEFGSLPIQILIRMRISPLGKQVHKISSSQCIGRCKYGLTIFFFY